MSSSSVCAFTAGGPGYVSGGAEPARRVRRHVQMPVRNCRLTLALPRSTPARSLSDSRERKYAHRTISGGVGHNLPQEAPEAFAEAVIEVDGWGS